VLRIYLILRRIWILDPHCKKRIQAMNIYLRFTDFLTEDKAIFDNLSFFNRSDFSFESKGIFAVLVDILHLVPIGPTDPDPVLITA